jgi:hypothetical protein
MLPIAMASIKLLTEKTAFVRLFFCLTRRPRRFSAVTIRRRRSIHRLRCIRWSRSVHDRCHSVRRLRIRSLRVHSLRRVRCHAVRSHCRLRRRCGSVVLIVPLCRRVGAVGIVHRLLAARVAVVAAPAASRTAPTWRVAIVASVALVVIVPPSAVVTTITIAIIAIISTSTRLHAIVLRHTIFVDYCQ